MEHGRTFQNHPSYAEQKWGPIPTRDDAIIGTYDTPLDGVIAVRYLEKGPSGNPEFEVEWSDGMMVTVLDAACAFQYLDRDHAVKRDRSH